MGRVEIQDWENEEIVKVLTFYSVEWWPARCACTLRRTTVAVCAPSRVTRANPWLGRCVWASHGIRLLGCWSRRWAARKDNQTDMPLNNELKVLPKRSAPLWKQFDPINYAKTLRIPHFIQMEPPKSKHKVYFLLLICCPLHTHRKAFAKTKNSRFARNGGGCALLPYSSSSLCPDEELGRIHGVRWMFRLPMEWLLQLSPVASPWRETATWWSRCCIRCANKHFKSFACDQY